MMFYTEEWLTEAEDELALLWMQAPDKLAITQAQAAIEKLLRSDPTGHGTPLGEELWKLAVPPLVVYYTIDTPRSLVEVSWVARTS